MCRFCHGDVQPFEVKKHSLASESAFHHDKETCDPQHSFPSCDHISVGGDPTVKSFSRRAAFGVRCVGDDRADLRTFCRIVDLPPPVGGSSYNIFNSIMETATCAVQATGN